MRIRTNNLLLKSFRAKDITDEYVNALNDKSIVGLTEARHKTWGYANVKKFVNQSVPKNGYLLVGIFLKENGKHIGNIRLVGISDQHKRAELGIMLFDKSQWGKGYGTESLNAVVDYAFKEMKLHRICADYYSVNAASAKIFEKAGFVIEGVFKDHFLLDGKFVDSVRVAKISGVSRWIK
jgi:RimJ/RimL family protein N-acetyltransferase